jgi:hypothetical protein
LRAKGVLASVSFLRAHATSDNMEGGRSELRVRACLRLRHRMGWLR